LTSLIGLGSGNFRYDGDETEAFYSTALSSGKYAIYRERPSANVIASNTSIEYGGSTPTISSSVLQNGDVLSASIASASYTDHGEGVSYLDVKYSGSHSGDDIAILSYSISENLSGLGYDVTADTITVTPKVVSL
jgi:hypothetical protein